MNTQQGIYDEQADFVEPIGKGLFRWDDLKDLTSSLWERAGSHQRKADHLIQTNSDQGLGFMALARLARDRARRTALAWMLLPAPPHAGS